ncbi:hypothetical protein RQP46_010588 [Phenoliferia psychrophenolica]
MKQGSKTLDDLKGLFRERAVMEEDHSKKLIRLAKSTAGTGEIGHMERAVLQIKGEIGGSAKAHADLADLLRKQEHQLGDFLNRRETARKQQQTAIEKLWKQKREQIEVVSKAKGKYETDALAITGLHAQGALSQGRELDKLTMKMEKIQQTVVVNERDYRNYVNQWRAYCDLCQDQEEERLDFTKSRLWDWANALSTVAVAEDESAERSRTALEMCDPATDLKIFVQASGTGNEIPDPPVFIDYKIAQAPSKPTYKAARFPRSSTRQPGMTHSPSDVDQIAAAFKTPPPGQPAQLPQQSIPVRAQAAQQDPRGRSHSQGRQGQSPNPIMASVAQNAMPSSSNGSSSRPFFPPEDRDVSPSKSNTPNLLDSVLSQRRDFPDHPTSPSRQTSRPAFESNHSSSSMFAVSPNATAKQNPSADRPPASSSSIGVKAGLANAGAFRRGPSSIASPTHPPPGSGGSEGGGRYEPSSPTKLETTPSAPPPEEEDDDPISRALMEFQKLPTQPLRNSRSFGGPMAGAIALPGMAQQQQQQQPQRPTSTGYGDQPTQRGSQNYGRPASRPHSPAPQASMMQPPHESAIPAVVNNYGQAFPGERNTSRPPSRQGSTTSHNSQQPPQQQFRSPSPQPNFGRSPSPQPNYGRSPSPQPNFGQQQRSPSPQPRQTSNQPLVGVGARGRSPSPQPFNHPGGVWQNPGPPPPQQQQHHASAPPPQQLQQQGGGYFPSQNALARPVSPAPQQHGRGASLGYRAPSPSQSFGQGQGQQQHRAPSPSQSFGQHHQQQSGYGPPPSQSFQAPPPQGYPSSTSPFQPQQQQQPQQTNGHQYQGSQSHGGGYSPAPQVVRAPSPAPAPAPAPAAASNGPPPTGQYDQYGKPILFYVNAIYDYAAQGPEEFDFSTGDVIAVTATDPDGWWQGRPVGVIEGGHIFPSNFTELLA